MGQNVQKNSIRRLALLRRGRIDPSERAALGAAVCKRLLDLPEVRDAGTVLAFVSIRSEVPTGRLLETILGAGKTLLLPSVAEGGTLRASAVASLDELAPGYRGIPEPRAPRPVDPATADVIVVPGVAFDPAGGRLGYGGGFYDALLRSVRGVPRVGICFETQVVDRVPMEEHDERVDVLVTEERTIRCRA